MKEKSLLFCYGLDYCSKSGALYIDGKLAVEDPRVGDFNLLGMLGYTDIKALQVDQDWLTSEEVNWSFPKKLCDIIFQN